MKNVRKTPAATANNDDGLFTLLAPKKNGDAKEIISALWNACVQRSNSAECRRAATQDGAYRTMVVINPDAAKLARASRAIRGKIRVVVIYHDRQEADAVPSRVVLTFAEWIHALMQARACDPKAPKELFAGIVAVQFHVFFKETQRG